MRQALHLLIVDRQRELTIVTSHGNQWLLPIVICPERTRPGPLIAGWLTGQPLTADVIGHWLGRVTQTGDSIDWLVAIDAISDPRMSHALLTWIPIAELRGRPALLAYQQWAIDTALHDGPFPSVPGPFGAFAWLDDVKRWMCRMTGVSAIGPLTSYRAAAREVVLSARTTHGAVYFKGLASERSVEARTTQAMSKLAPDSFARTLAIDTRSDGSVWWLTAECPGQPARDGHRVARALAQVQQTFMTSSSVAELPLIDLDAAAAWSIALLNGVGLASAIARASTAMSVLPRSWLPLDIDPSNVRVDNEGAARFIDLDDSFVGPAPIATAILARRWCDRTVYVSYEQAWRQPLERVDWNAVEIVAATLEAWLGWLTIKRRIESGELFGLLGLAESRLRERLTAAIEQISITEEPLFPTRPAGS